MDPQRRHDDNTHKHLRDVSMEFISPLEGYESSVSANKHHAFEDRGNTETGTENGFLLWSWEKQKFFSDRHTVNICRDKAVLANLSTPWTDFSQLKPCRALKEVVWWTHHLHTLRERCAVPVLFWEALDDFAASFSWTWQQQKHNHKIKKTLKQADENWSISKSQ